jgi:hypothetical protein
MEYFIPQRYQTFVSKSSASSELGDGSLPDRSSLRRRAKRCREPWQKVLRTALGISSESGQKAIGMLPKEAE